MKLYAFPHEQSLSMCCFGLSSIIFLPANMPPDNDRRAYGSVDGLSLLSHFATFTEKRSDCRGQSA